MSSGLDFEYNYADVMRALRPFSSRPVTKKEQELLNPRYINYYSKNTNPTMIKGGAFTSSPYEIILAIDININIPVNIYVYTGVNRASGIILGSIELRAFDFIQFDIKKSINPTHYPVESISIKNNAKSHVLERLQKNIAKLIKKIKEDIKPCPEKGCDGLIVEKFSAKTQSTFWACNRYPSCKYIDRERSKKSGGVDPGPDDKICSKCGKKMVKRMAKKGLLSGKQFWGCSAFPDCKNTENIEKET